MSTSIRDMYVGVSIRDDATRTLSRIDASMNSLEANFRRFGSNVNGSFRGMNGLNSRIDASANNMRILQRYTNRLEQEMSEARTEMQRMAERIRIAEEETEDLRNEMQRVNSHVNDANKSMGIFGSTAGKVLGIVGAVFAADKVKDFALSAIESSAGFQAMNAQFEQVFTGMQSTADDNLNKIAKDTGMLPERLKGSFTQIAAFAKTTGADTAAALSLTERATLAAADSAAFYDRSIEEVIENMQSFLKGNFENDAALGISATETTRNAKANQLYGKSFIKLDEAQKQLTLMAMVEDGNKLSGALGQASREADAYENQLGNLKQSWTNFKGKIGGPLLEPFVQSMKSASQWIENIDTDKLVNKFGRVVNFAGTVKNTIVSMWNNTGNISDLWQKFGLSKEASDDVAAFGNTMRKVVVVGIKAVSMAFNGLKAGVGWLIDHKEAVIAVGGGIATGFAAFKGINAAIDAFKTIKSFAGAFTMLSNPVGIAALAIGGLVMAGIYLYRNWDTIKAKALELWQTLRENPMMAMVAGPIGALISAGVYLYNNWDTIKERAIGLWTTITEKFAEIKQSVSDFVQPAIGWFESIGQKWDNFKSSLANFKVPEWVSTVGSKIGSLAGGGVFKKLFNGSHATGLERVPFDGYVAELHKGESVLTERQSNALRSAGILSQNSDGTPELNMGGGGTTQQAPNAGGGGHQFIFQITGDNPLDIAQKVREVVSDLLGEELQIM